MYLELFRISFTKRGFSAIQKRFISCETDVRVRFAPSPTGSIHLGGLRTALYNYIFARQNGGKFIVRIEDTDQTRVVPGSADEIEEILEWSGLVPDESPIRGGQSGPYVQSSRLDLYNQQAEELLEAGSAYRCFCSSTRLELVRNYQLRNRQKPRYDGKCKHLSQEEVQRKLEQEEPYAIRFKLQPGVTQYEDMIFGSLSRDFIENLESDPIILKSDKYPTYHFANVVDDHSMKISHVLRGAEWISSTGMHIQIYRAFGWQHPKFAHFPLIAMKDGAKMSKRNNQSHVKSWRADSFSALAIVNFIVGMGGGLPKDKQDRMDIWDLDRIVNEFDFSRVQNNVARVDIDRLLHYNQNHLIHSWSSDSSKVIGEIKKLMVTKNISTDLDDDAIKAIVGPFIVGKRIMTLSDLFAGDFAYVWQAPPLTWSVSEYADQGIDLKLIVQDIIEIIEASDSMEKEFLDERLRVLAARHSITYPMLMRLVRKILVNSDKGPPVYEIFSCLGKERLIEYLRQGLKLK